MKANEQMDAETRLMKALAVGAVAAFRPNLMNRLEAQKEIATAYLELKDKIQKRYGRVQVHLLDIAPGSADRQAALAQQLKEAGVTEDEEILKQAQRLLDIVWAEDPEALWATEPADPAPQHK